MSEFSESRRLLIRRTLENASLIPFYQEHWNEVLSGRYLQDLDLTDFPMLDKSKYRERYMFDTRSLTEASLVTHTSGTSGELTWRHRTNIEAGVVATVFEKLLTHNVERPLVLSVQYGRHGMGMPMPSNCDVFPIALSDETELLQAIAATRTPFHIGGTPRFPTVLTGGVQHIALLAQARLDRGYGPETSSIKQLGRMDTTQVTLIHKILAAADERNLPLWIGGGWAIDARLGRVTRKHDDIDLTFPGERRGELEAIVEMLGGRVMEELDYGFLAEIGDELLDCEPAWWADEAYEIAEAPQGSCPEAAEGVIAGRPVRCNSWEAIIWDYFYYADEVPPVDWPTKHIESYRLACTSLGAEKVEVLRAAFRSRYAA